MVERPYVQARQDAAKSRMNRSVKETSVFPALAAHMTPLAALVACHGGPVAAVGLVVTR